MALAWGLNGGGYADLYPNQNGSLAVWNRALRLGQAVRGHDHDRRSPVRWPQHTWRATDN
ncbi:MAG: hypothetical protein JWO45_1580 [Spartobacteria bacterium]|nr:hypothetical protein [Spartobacteria bacterium]